MPTDPEFKPNFELFGDNVPRRSIVVSSHLTQVENNAMKSKAQAAGMTQAEFLQQCLKSGIDDALASNSQAQGTSQSQGANS